MSQTWGHAMFPQAGLALGAASHSAACHDTYHTWGGFTHYACYWTTANPYASCVSGWFHATAPSMRYIMRYVMHRSTERFHAPLPQASTATQQAGAPGMLRATQPAAGGSLAPTVSLELADVPGPGSTTGASAAGGYSTSGESQLGGSYGSGGMFGSSSAGLAGSQAGSQGPGGSQPAEQLRLRRRVYGWVDPGLPLSGPLLADGQCCRPGAGGARRTMLNQIAAGGLYNDRDWQLVGITFSVRWFRTAYACMSLAHVAHACRPGSAHACRPGSAQRP
jgi:hypothetical protein